MELSPQQRLYFAWQLTKTVAGNSIESLASTLIDSQVDLNPHQVDAALFACRNPLSRGVLLADEVGLGKTIEAGLVIAQAWAERRRKILIIVPANLRKQWYQELYDKFGLKSLILESKNYNQFKKQGNKKPFVTDEIIICSYQFAKAKASDIRGIQWDLVIIDEAHRLRNVYKTNNITSRSIKDALSHVNNKVLLTATPLQNSLLELFGLVSFIDDRVFGDLDSFKQQFTQGNRDIALPQLKQRLDAICKRTLRKQVQPFVAYTARRAIVQDFNPTQEEQALSALVADYLRRPHLKALPDGQRQLISLVLWKLLASSSQAIAGVMQTMIARLEEQLENSAKAGEQYDLLDALDQDFETLNESADEADLSDEDLEAILSPADKQAIRAEIDELRHFQELAQNIRQQSKGQALLQALEKAFSALDELGAEKKAIIFTESRRTQDYLSELLQDTPYGQGLVLFNGTNTDAKAQTIYKDWVKRYANTDRVTGSKTADMRAALVDYFREQGSVMIATEAGSEGINLQFCSLVINYDLPWNPQRIEQRIGRCHRYGQKHDVVVVNFVDRSNAADSRVYDLLSEKFQLFDGVFGASDEILGSIGSGVDFERRIVEIYQQCRSPEEIQQSFEQLQQELSQEINQALLNTRDLLLSHFDENVLQRIKTDAGTVRHSHEQMLLRLTQDTLAQHPSINAQFDDNGFYLPQSTHQFPHNLKAGYYGLARMAQAEHIYRLSHPFATWMLHDIKQDTCTAERLVFDYDAYGVQVSSLKPLQGQAGQLIAVVLTVISLGRKEEHIVVAAITQPKAGQQGTALPDDDPEKLLKLPVVQRETISTPQWSAALYDELNQRKNQLLEAINIRNLEFFEQETIKLDSWADDLKNGLELEIKDIDREIKEVRRTAVTAATLQDKLLWQKKQRELEGKRTKLRRELFNRQDEIDIERNELIEQLEQQLEQRIEETPLFKLEWQLR